MPESRDAAEQYTADKWQMLREVGDDRLDPSLATLMSAFRFLAARWDEALDGLDASSTTTSMAADDAWPPVKVMNHTAGALDQAQLMIRGALRGIHQAIDDIDGQWLGDALSFEAVYDGAATAFADFDSAIRAASAHSGPTGTISAPWLDRGEVRHWVRNMTIHLAEHVAQLRKVRGLPAGDWQSGIQLYIAAIDQAQQSRHLRAK